jgi:hypothetical protein
LQAKTKPGGPASIDSDWPTLEELQRRYIERVLDHTGQNKTSAASILGIDRRTIQRLASREAGKDGDRIAASRCPRLVFMTALSAHQGGDGGTQVGDSEWLVQQGCVAQAIDGGLEIGAGEP